MTHSHTRYVRITLKDNAVPKVRPFFLQVTSESALFVSGYEVDKDGEEIIPRDLAPNGEKYERRLRVVAKGAIRHLSEYRMSNHYGTLEATK